MPPKTDTKAIGWGKIYQRIQTTLSEGPRNPAEWWIYELAKTVRKDKDASSMVFSVATLLEAFRISKDVFPACPEFYGDVCSLIKMLPVKDGDLLERRLLVNLLRETARECDTVWWYNTRERAALLFGVMHACMIQRKAEQNRTVDDLAILVSGMKIENKDLNIDNEDMKFDSEDLTIITELVGSLDGLKLDRGVQND